jgi:nitrate/nitrite transporter NarK
MLLAALNLLADTALLRFSVGFKEGFLFVYVLTFGISFSGAFTMIQLIVAELYAGPSYGKILGIVTIVDSLAGSLGIFVLGKMKELSGSYISAFNLLVVICIAAAISVIFIKRQMKVKGVNA